MLLSNDVVREETGRPSRANFSGAMLYIKNNPKEKAVGAPRLREVKTSMERGAV